VLLGVAVLSARAADAAQLTGLWTDNSAGSAAFALERRASTNASFAPLADMPIGMASYVDTSGRTLLGRGVGGGVVSAP